MVIMIIKASDWQVFPILLFGGICLGMIGALYLAYDLFERPKVLHRYVWGFSSGYLFAFVLLTSCFILIGPDHLIGPKRFTAGYLPTTIWRTVGIFSFIALMMQTCSFSLSPMRFSSRSIDWLRLAFSVIWSGVGLVAFGVVIAPHGYSLIEAAIFALPSVLVLGILNGFSPAIQWWALQLPEKRMAATGALFIFCVFALMLGAMLLVILSVLV